MIARVIIGFLVAVVGWLLVWKTAWFVMMLGSIDWAERHLGGGGTTLFYKLLGIVIIIIGFLVVTNLFEGFTVWLLGGIFSGAR